MRKHFFLTVLLSGFLLPAMYAQLGIKGGVNVSSIVTDVDDIQEENSIVGWQTGLMFNMPIQAGLPFNPKYCISEKGPNTST
ncbi:MAG: hypothetical protein IPK76_03130 [Lewinellaceae bacterium]|nr:hypothetical protein [Lewinellaceae bacterium]